MLSLDAPLVAVAWLNIFSVSWRLFIPWQAYVSLGLAVWVIYAADRLLDASVADVMGSPLEARHRFHKKYRKAFIAGIIIALLTAATIVVTSMPVAVYSHLLVAGILTAGFFGLSLNRNETDSLHLKNTIAGFTFAFGTAITAQVYRQELDFIDFILIPEFLLFALLCILNISAIDIWEHAARAPDEETKASDEISLALPVTLLAAASLYFALRSESERPFHYAVLTATGLIYLINRQRDHLSADARRVLADAALLVPWVLFAATSGS